MCALPLSLRCLPAVVGLVAAILFAGVVAAAQRGPQCAMHPLAADGQLVPSATDRCPVCAMFPARYPQAAAAMTLHDGTTYYFCSNGCLFRTWLRSKVYLGVPQKQIERLVVLDYFSGKPIDARTATWVAGSDVIGPMGPAIIALQNPAHVAAFTKRHGAQTIFTFDQLDDHLWRTVSRHRLPEP